MKRKVYLFYLILFVAFTTVTGMNAKSTIHLGTWCIDFPLRNSNEGEELKVCCKLELKEDSTFSYSVGYVNVFLWEEKVGAFVLAERQGTYVLKDSAMFLEYNDKPITYKSGPVFNSSHGELTKRMTQESVISPWIEKYKKITKDWVEGSEPPPSPKNEVKIVSVDDKQLEITWKENGETKQIHWRMLKEQSEPSPDAPQEKKHKPSILNY